MQSGPVSVYESSLPTTTRVGYWGSTISGSRNHDLTVLRDIPVAQYRFPPQLFGQVPGIDQAKNGGIPRN